jgi:hypothetical protein
VKRRILYTLIMAGLVLLYGCAERQDANLPYNVITYLSTTPVRGQAYDVAVVGNRAYVADYYYGIGIYDLSDPAAPQLVDSIQTDEPYAKLVAVDPSARILAVESETSSTGQIFFYDLMNKRLILIAGSSHTTKIRLTFSNDTLSFYRTDRDVSTDGFFVERYLNISTGDTLVISPTIFTALYQNASPAYGFALSGSNRAYECLDLTGFAVLDFTAPGTPTLIGQMNTPGICMDAALSGNTLCLASGYPALITLNVADPANPVQLGSLIIPNSPNVEKVEAIGNRAYLMDINDGVFVVDISNPASPMLIGSLLTSKPSGFCVAGDLIVIADQDMGLVVGQIMQ